MANKNGAIRTILVVGKQQDGRLISELGLAGFNVEIAPTSKKGMIKLYECRPDAVILEDNLSPIDGKHMHKRLREISVLPCIVIGDRDDFARSVIIEEGADLYLDSTVSPGAIIAYIWSLLNRYENRHRGPRFHPDKKTVDLGDCSHRLTNTEFRLFSCLAFNSGRILSYARLLAEVWGKEATLETVHQYIRRLKQKLGIDSVGPYRLLNYRGEGYCFSFDLANPA
jgi:two-component system KDP operon response regulator KdpE